MILMLNAKITVLNMKEMRLCIQTNLRMRLEVITTSDT